MLGVGVFAGVLAGLLGVGGGIIIVPALFQLFAFMDVDLAVRMHLAVGTSLSTIIVTSISSLRSHSQRGAVDWQLLRSFGPSVAVGVITGTAIAGVVSGAALTAVFAVMALIVAWYMGFAPDDLRFARELPGGARRAAIGGVIGAISAMVGIGGGSLTVPTLVLCNYPIRQAVGTAAAVGLIIAIPGTAGFMLSGLDAEGLPPLSVGYVNLVGFAILVPVTWVAAPWGARLAHWIRPRLLRLCFAGFLFVVSIRLFASLV
ncbi:MAG: TSUP family transporter [Alphaproteobacteria bacterium]|nr:TSUP family transporter [Alphaproteobacteria bacterium]